MERSFLAYVRGRCRHLPQVDIGIGDDAAVYTPVGRQVVCTDQIIDGVDFRWPEHRGVDIGYKSVAINLSDIAAMGAIADSALVTLAIPKHNAIEIAGDVYEGIIEAATQFNLAIIGGDISTYEGPLAISVTMIGHLPDGQSAWQRGGARPEQIVFASGAFGGSLLGRHLRPTPRIKLAGELRAAGIAVTAAIDVSDGLSLDLDRLCAASNVGVVLETSRIPIHPDAIARGEQSGDSAFRHAWSDGEDFELLLTVSPEDAGRIESSTWSCDLTRIAKTSARTGLWTMEGSKLIRLSPQGYLH
jgi:thiamine-monophosphate kinase